MNLLKRAAWEINERISPGIAFRVDLLRPSLADSWGGPMNGQVKRWQMIRDMITLGNFDEVVETGTYRSTTTRFLHHISALPVHSAEIEERFFRYSAALCRPYSGIRLYHGDSREMLRSLSGREGDPRLLFYLDAHWQADVPRYEELEIIAKRWSHAVVVIDDFKVPDDPGYAFTSYDGSPLDIKYLPVLPRWQAFYPAAASTEETGARRGCIVLASPEMAPVMQPLTSLRRAHLA